MRQSFARPASVLLVSVALACGEHSLDAGLAAAPLAPHQVLVTNATVRFVDLEGGCWVLETATGTYEPIDLPTVFRIDGLAVYAVVRSAPGAVSICQMAPLVSLDTIRVR